MWRPTLCITIQNNSSLENRLQFYHGKTILATYKHVSCYIYSLDTYAFQSSYSHAGAYLKTHPLDPQQNMALYNFSQIIKLQNMKLRHWFSRRTSQQTRNTSFQNSLVPVSLKWRSAVCHSRRHQPKTHSRGTEPDSIWLWSQLLNHTTMPGLYQKGCSGATKMVISQKRGK